MSKRDDFRDQVREKSDLITIIGKSATLKGHGKTLKANCPFHQEDTPSLVVWPDTERWHCFGACNCGGDVFDWVQKRDGVDFPTALAMLAHDAGMEIPEYEESSPGEREERQNAESLLKLAAEWYHDQLLSNSGAEQHRQYLLSRGFDHDVWKKWQVGAAGNRNRLLGYLQSMGADLVLAQKIGLIAKGEHDEHLYDWFRDRIVIPLIHHGRVVFMTGRTISADGVPKYLHLPNTPFARKIPYNASNSANDLVIVEGPLDVWAVDQLGGNGIAAVGLMGIASTDHMLQKTLKRRERIFIGLDGDKAGRSNTEAAIEVAGYSRSHIVTWPGGDDAASWLKAGAIPEEFAALLEAAPKYTAMLVMQIENAAGDDKIPVVEKAVRVASLLQPANGDALVKKIKSAAKNVISSSTISAMFLDARKAFAPSTNGNGHKPPAEQQQVAEGDQDDKPFYWIRDGEIWRGNGSEAALVVRGGSAYYTSMVTIDDGEEQELELQMEIRLTTGRTFNVRIPADVSGETGKVTSLMKKVVGPLITIEARQGPYVIPAVEALSTDITEQTEIVRTGWVETEAGLAFCTPGGVIGELPEGHKAVAPVGMPNMNRYAVRDSGADAFSKGLHGLLHGLLKAFDPVITYPLLAYAILPVASRYMPKHKFALHISGETGSLKTATSKTLMSLYGDFVDAPAIQSWRSTVNSIEQTGFWLPDVLGLVDDYKPSVVKPWDFTELIQRYADGNDRSRLGRDGKLRSRQAMRWWMLSTGEDLPGGEASVLARMVTIRFPRRPQGSPYNVYLGNAQAEAQYFPTITAHWAAWLAGSGIKFNVQDKMLNYHEHIAIALQAEASEVPNVNRLARNIAMLWTAWDMWWDFIADTFGEPGVKKQALKRAQEFADLAIPLALTVARQVIAEKPVRVFLGALQEGLDSGRFAILPRNDTTEVSRLVALIGWHDKEGVYILPDAYNEVAKRLRETGQSIGFTKQELYRLLDEEGMLLRKGKDETTVTIQVGIPVNMRPKRVLVLNLDALELPSAPPPPAPLDIG
jgi:DNA primase catalytic core